MKDKRAYRKNFLLVTAFVILISAFVIAILLLSYKLTRRYIENEFGSRKVDVLEQTIRPYNDFFQNKIAEITSYNGFLNVTSAAKYSGSVFSKYPFVKNVTFYDLDISNNLKRFSFRTNHLSIYINSVYSFLPGKNSNGLPQVKALKKKKLNDADFNQMSLQLSDYIEDVDTAKISSPDIDLRKNFYNIRPNKISYLNIPLRQELKLYKELLRINKPVFNHKQNMFTFYLDPFALKIRNTNPGLYQSITIRPLVYDPIDNDQEKFTTEIAFPGAFSNYKLYFRTNKSFLTHEIIKSFLPIAFGVMLIYFFLLTIALLIYRNLNVNLKLFKLQYDFINNFTHEFKTPVSVIKIAGSNLQSKNELSERQRIHYGKILNEEADKLNELMNKLLSFTQLENKSIQIKSQQIDLDQFTKSQIESLRIKYPSFNISYTDSDIHAFFTDPVLLGSIYQNLMENAYKYSPPERKELAIKIEKNKKEVIFKFKDQGIGIDQAELNNIFKKFYRIQNQYNQNGSVGLGLAFCKELVNFMHGEISVKSSIGKGSEFVVALPYEH
ncbi:sensor histidine kinase [Mucilaginibacter arboris]|uniref:histidine kinase n=1 Tax=Mucilaginibacter arboris TaxID=2682090 RepID=A0A7K1SUY0_9SPHI|nr:HAMP domain-containing sensor histidine kinase [Mucilaginibacter arboris]MVN21131.1 sensor histidine kinase [Mucilaginibacter arboris]